MKKIQDRTGVYTGFDGNLAGNKMFKLYKNSMTFENDYYFTIT